ncbi:uncharacterized protein MYCGRDRAFT_69157 [Zymoseptoria tritici IPO323]|uniref:Glutamyl-tRNA synthetase n=1 Tax=Zymoseptoria tritici (strain CBS 115943 / IPO323) TaxID=336722 RepID=F9X4Y1_ZYMTI|nr:uncharacterized protein MYCGRDRAFT_69157 [Zymoseptoria tritici IPO323]EGP90216.1 hypothetical protein MYCGRDRAFT_69157 [Zymoseptoria tritici IPO323]
MSSPSSEEKQEDRFTTARNELYQSHSLDPNTHTLPSGETKPYETHYAEKMEKFLTQRSPSASEVLRLAIIGQHFRRWEVPRSSYPDGKPGYLRWRSDLKKRQAAQVGGILMSSGYDSDETDRCRALIEKEGLKKAEEDEEVQVLEDVACLVFLDDQFEEFKEKHDEEKMVGILSKTWGKMSERGRELAMGLPMTDEARALVGKALEG